MSLFRINQPVISLKSIVRFAIVDRRKRGGWQRGKPGKRRQCPPIYKPYPGGQCWDLLPPEIQEARLSDIPDHVIRRIGNNPQNPMDIRTQMKEVLEKRNSNIKVDLSN